MVYGRRVYAARSYSCGYVSKDSTYRVCGGNAKETYLEILYFRQFYKHFVFKEDEAGNRNKRLEKYFEVSVVVDVGCGETKELVF